MKLLRFISTDEMAMLVSGHNIKSINDYSEYPTTLGNKDVVYFLDLEKADDYAKEAQYEYNPGESLTVNRIVFYELLLSGVIDNYSFAVIVERPRKYCMVGKGQYADLRYVTMQDEDDPNKYIDESIWVREVGLVSYSFDDIIEIYEIVDGGFEKMNI